MNARAAAVVTLFILGLGFAGGFAVGRDQGFAVAWDSFECRDVTDPNEWVWNPFPLPPGLR